MPSQYPNLKKVVVVFKTHFDLGFTDLPDRVMSLYTGPFFDGVRETVGATEAEPENLHYTWTLPSWPLKQLLDDPNLPPEAREAAHRLVSDGRLAWHAWPFTTHTAFCGLEDLVRGLHVSRGLSERFGRWPGAAKQTDVPGHIWIFPSLLARAGVRFLHLGCNAGSHPPRVPRVFWWEGPDGTRLLTFYSAGGYGTSPLPPADWPYDTWLALQHTVDNHGPHSPDDLRRIREEIEQRAPHAEILFGQLQDFADVLLQNPAQLEALPVVAYDLADTWIHGVGTMPREVARVRALRPRLLELEYITALEGWPGKRGEGQGFSLARKVAPLIDSAYEQLMLFGEHTWGLDVKSTIKREFGGGFSQARETEPYKLLESSWRAKAAYVDRAEALYADAVSMVQDAVNSSQIAPKPSWALEGHPAGPVEESEPSGRRNEPENVLNNGSLRLEVDPVSGGIASLVDLTTGREWVARASGEPFGGYRYDIYSAADIAEFLRAYGQLFQEWFLHDFGKPGYPEDIPHFTAYARNFTLRNDGGIIYLEGGRLHAPSGADLLPHQDISINIGLSGDGPNVYLDYHITNKAATPLTESAVVPFPLSLPKATFRLGQVGSVIAPARDIAPGANHHLWCVDGWVDASDDRVGFAVIPRDMPLVSIGDIGIYKFSLNRLPTQPTLYSHLFNTQWGTNFPQWHEGDFHFRIELLPHAGDWRAGNLWESDLVARHSRSIFGMMPISMSDGLVLTSLRPRHDGPGLVARYWDALGLPRRVSITINGPVAAVWRCDLMERPQEQLSLSHNASTVTTDFQIAAHAIETLLIEFK